MSQSVTLYRVSQNSFKQLEMLKGMTPFDASCAKSCITLDQASGLEHILSKGKSDHEKELISEIFCPGTIIGLKEFEALSIEDRFEYLDAKEIISYIDIDTVVEIDAFINKMTPEEISLNFNSDDLNSKEIYSINWLDDNSPNLSYNERHILDGFLQLQVIFKEATMNGDYVIVDYGGWNSELNY